MRYSDALEIPEFRELKEKHAAAKAEYENLCDKRNALNLLVDQADKTLDRFTEAVHAWLDSH